MRLARLGRTLAATGQRLETGQDARVGGPFHNSIPYAVIYVNHIPWRCKILVSWDQRSHAYGSFPHVLRRLLESKPPRARYSGYFNSVKGPRKHLIAGKVKINRGRAHAWDCDDVRQRQDTRDSLYQQAMDCDPQSTFNLLSSAKTPRR